MPPAAVNKRGQAVREALPARATAAGTPKPELGGTQGQAAPQGQTAPQPTGESGRILDPTTTWGWGQGGAKNIPVVSEML